MGLSVQQLADLANISIPKIQSGEKATTGDNDFGLLFDKALGVLNDTNAHLKAADQMAVDFALGKVDNIHDVMIAQEKASIALQYTVRIRDGLLDAYNDIMRMQV